MCGHDGFDYHFYGDGMSVPGIDERIMERLRIAEKKAEFRREVLYRAENRYRIALLELRRARDIARTEMIRKNEARRGGQQEG